MRSRKGQSLVEFALVVPLFLLLLIGTVEFGRAWMTRNIMTGASREAVRVAAVQGSDNAARSRAHDILTSAGISGASVDIGGLDDGVSFGPCTVTVTYDFPLSVADFLPGLSGSKIALAASTSMRKEF